MKIIMENLDESDYQAIILWNCQYNYFNGMLQQSKQASQAFPYDENLKIYLAVANILTNRVQEALQIGSDLIAIENSRLAGLLIQNTAHRLNGSKDKAIITQTDAKIRDERRKATYKSLTRAAIILLLLKKYDKAKEYAERAYKLNSHDLDVLIVNGWIDLNYSNGKNNNYFLSIGKEHGRRLNVLLGTAKFHQHHDAYEQAILILNALVVRYPKLCIPLVEKMFCQLGVQDWDQVLETANRILTLDANNLDAVKAKTVVTLCRDGDNSMGMKNTQLFLRTLLAAEAKNVPIMIDNIQLFSQIIHRDEETLIEMTKIMEKLIQQNSNICEPMIELGNIFLLMNKVKEAEHWYRNAIRIDESSFSALMGLAHCQVLDKSPGSIELARQQVDFLMEIQSKSLDPQLYFMSAKLSHNDSVKALNYTTMAIKLVLKNIENVSYGYEYLKKLNPDFSLELVNEHLTHSPTESTKHNEKISSDNNEKPEMLTLLIKVTEACPAFSAALLMLAKANMQYGNCEDALSTLRKLLDTVDSTNAMAHILMAKILAVQGNYQSASQSLEVGLSYNFKVRDEFLYHLINGIVEKAEGNLNAGINSFRTAMTLMDSKSENDSTQISISDKATLYLELILSYGKLKKFEEASALMSEAKMQFINTMEEGRIIMANAELCLELGDIEKAINYLNDIQSGEPYYIQAHTKLAKIYLHQRKDRHAFAKCFRELVVHCPSPKTYSMLGDAYMEIQEPDRAIEAYEQSLKNDPTNRILVNKMGKALIKTHQYERAINYYKEIVKNKDCGNLKLDMAELFMRMKQFDKAESTLLQELHDGRTTGDQMNLEVRVKQLLLLAKVQERADKINISINTLKEAKETQLRHIQRVGIGATIAEQKKILAEICLKMADQCTAIRDFDGAILYYKDALQYKPSDVNALLSLAKLYMQVNDLDRGAQSCTALLNADPNNEAASVMMADLAFRKVDFETAAYHFRQLLIRRPTYWTALARLIEVSRRTGNIDDLDEWISRAEATTEASNLDAGFHYCSGLRDWRTGKLNSALRHFNAARRDPEWGQQSIYNMIEICLDPNDDSALSSEAFNEEDAEYQDSRTMALKTAQRLLQELNPKGSPHEMLTHRLLENFFLLTTKIKTNIERALQDCTALASQDTLRDHVGPALGLATAHILLKQTPRARNHLKRVAKNVWTFEDAEYLERCWLLLADIYVQSNKFDLANELLRKVLQHNATCVRAHELSGYIAEREQNYREAAERYSQAWKFGGKTKLSVGYKLAYCCLKSKRYADAIQGCNEVLRQNPDYPRIRKEILEKSINSIRT